MLPKDVENYFDTHRRSTAIALAILLVTVISGFFMGMGQTRNFSDQTRDLRDRQSTSAENQPPSGKIPTAIGYGDLATATFRPNTNWSSSLNDLATADESYLPVAAMTKNERRAAILARESLRAFDGAPPVVPHPIDQISSSSCMNCHSATGPQPVIAGRTPARMSHTFLSNCTQCHVASSGHGEGVTDWKLGLGSIETRFAGLSIAAAGDRAYPEAPPVIPHTIRMRENCYSCHGSGRVNALTTSHPERQNCTQCHAISAAKEGRDFDLLRLRKPVRFPIDLNPPPPPASDPTPEPDTKGNPKP